MGRIIDYPEISSFLDDDYLIVDGATGSTRKILGQTVVGVTDPEPIEDSTNPVQSGGVYNALDEIASDIDDLREDAYSIYPTKAASSTDADPIVSIEDAADDTPLKRMLAYIVPSMSGSGVPSKTNIRNFKVVSNLELYRTAKNMINPYNMFQESPTKVLLGVTQSNEKIFLKSGTYTINVRNTSGERLTAKWKVQDVADIYTSNTIVLNEDGFVSIYVENDSGISRSDIRTDFTLAPGEDALAYGTSNSGKYETTISFPYDRPVYLGTLDLVKGELLVTGFLFHRNSSQMNNTEDEPGWKNIGVYGGRLTPGTVDVKRYWAGPAHRIRYTYVNVGQKYVIKANGNSYDIILPKADYNYTQSQWISAAIDVQIIVPYSTPISYTIDPLELRTISGYNRYFTDSGNVALTYCINLNTFVNGKIDPEISSLDNKIDGVDARLTSEISEAEEAVDEKLLTLYPIDTVTGSATHFLDGADDIPMKDVVVQIEPKQDLHGQDAPYPAGGGKNLLYVPTGRTYTENGVTWTLNQNGSITVSGTATEASIFRYIEQEVGEAFNGDYYFQCFPAINTSIFSSGVLIGGTWFSIYSDRKTALTGLSGKIQQMWFQVRAGQTLNTTFYPMIYKASETVSEWSPYSNICPISGFTEAKVARTGVNVWDEEWEVGTFDSDGRPSSATDRIRSKNFCSCVPGTEYCFAIPNQNMRVYFYDADKAFLEYFGWWGETRTFTTPTNARFFKVLGSGAYGDTYNHDISINYPSTDHDYHPYAGNTYSITFPSEAGTVYGGELDVTNGTLTVDRAMVDLGTLNWMYYRDGLFYTSTLKTIAKSNGRCVSDIYVEGTFNISSPINGYMWMAINGRESVFRAVNTAYSDETAFKTAMDGHQLVYELVTPIIYTLTPTEIKSLLGDNNVWADCGNTEVTYRADTKLYIDKKIAEVINALS